MNSYFTIQSNRYGLEETLAGADREHPDETSQVLSCGGYRIARNVYYGKNLRRDGLNLLVNVRVTTPHS
jgi:hypothetical protein